GALAISQLGVEPLARPVNMDETSTYFGHIFVRKDSSISNVREMKGKTMVFVERATTAGYVFPLAYLKRNGVVQYDTFFKKTYFSGSHDGAIQAVLDGHADVGAAKNTILDRIIKEHPDIQDNLVIIASSLRVPSNGLCVTAETDENLKRKIKETLLSLDKDPDGKRVLQKFGALRFVVTSKNDYQPVFDMAQEADIDLSAYTYVNQ
ncbi:phosphate/phosphite/phosphonate ABC transporter substrate-binding protein, partial [Thermodesulfobacteriota bacterium]